MIDKAINTHLLFGLCVYLIILSVGCQDSTISNPSPEATAYEDVISYGNHPLQSYKLYLPANHNASTEIVIMVHGGGWVMGYHPDDSVSTFSGRYNWDIQNKLLDEGYGCAVMKYRTACYNTVPDQFSNRTMYYQNRMMEDIDLVVEDLESKSSSLGFNSSRYHLLGESAGGHIVLSYGIRANSSAKIVSVASMFGPTDLDATDFKQLINGVPLLKVKAPNYFLRRSNNCESVTNQDVRTMNSLKSFSDHGTIEIQSRNTFLDSLSPAKTININRATPMFITHGDTDILVPSNQATKMYDALQTVYPQAPCGEDDYSCFYKVKIYENCGHGWTGGNCQRNSVMNDIVKWIKQH